MTARSTSSLKILALASASLLIAGGAWAQQQSEGQAATRSLNAGPAQSTLTPRPDATMPRTRPTQARPQARTRTLEDILSQTRPSEPEAETEAQAETQAETETQTASTGVTLAPGETEPEPIALALGYYARGDKECAEIWPEDGDLAWLTPTSFTIDFGGCERGQFLQIGLNKWSEKQICVNETGNDVGSYDVVYEVVDTETLKRTARLSFDDSLEEDLWKFCRTEDVSGNARFTPET